MSPTFAFFLPIPVAIALAVFLVLLVALGAVLLSLHRSVPERAPARKGARPQPPSRS